MTTWEARRTLLLVNLASIVDRADEALLPAVYKEVGAALHVTPVGLGSLTLARSAVQAICYPLAAYMASRFNRVFVITLGAFLWATATFLVAVSQTFLEVAISRGLSGIGLALATPAIQALVADNTDDSNRGSAFGWLQFTSVMGSIIGNFIVLLLAPTTFLGIAGWRIAFHLVAAISVIVGILVWSYAVDPRFHNEAASNENKMTDKSALEEAHDFIKETKAIIQIPTFQIFIAQGVPGSFAGASLSFLPMWFELIGFSHKYTAFLLTLLSIAYAIGGVFAGVMGDFLARRLPNAGRIILSQISAGSKIPLAGLLLLGLPYDASLGALYAVAIFFMGLITCWEAAGTNNPIFAEIVPKKSRTSIYALDRSFETLLASFAPPIVGLLAERIYGYRTGDGIRSDDPKINQQNAASLAKALYTAVAIPMALCCSIYSFLYCTYPRDRDRANKDSELQIFDPDCQDEMSIVGLTCQHEEEFESDASSDRSPLMHR
ncbi:Major facilitator superfamily protein [Rhynchospora pubera]|uniref:Major facilitator superfamily protein n=1 Tax=Rhynchospora pubera TaxID=906938 RepID=A0AAV8CFG4_9POAL|nr:Major facilitator superfamily protein [Rhynchospora pubera]KAJ4753570.1 Major facilitator superfamily protein [Rhynchospora pubera]